MSLTPAALRQHILNAAADYLGTYTYINGYSGVAITVGNPPNDIKVSGLEVIIPNYPRVTRSTQGGRMMHREELWDIVLVRWDEDRANFYNAVDSLFNYFPRASGNEVLQDSVLKTKHQYIITVKYSHGYDRAGSLTC